MASEATPSLFNGERAVVLVFIASVLFSLPVSLLLHGLALSLLVISALFVEIRAEASTALSLFKIRYFSSQQQIFFAIELLFVVFSGFYFGFSYIEGFLIIWRSKLRLACKFCSPLWLLIERWKSIQEILTIQFLYSFGVRQVEVLISAKLNSSS